MQDVESQLAGSVGYRQTELGQLHRRIAPTSRPPSSSAPSPPRSAAATPTGSSDSTARPCRISGCFTGPCHRSSLPCREAGRCRSAPEQCPGASWRGAVESSTCTSTPPNRLRWDCDDSPAPFDVAVRTCRSGHSFSSRVHGEFRFNRFHSINAPMSAFPIDPSRSTRDLTRGPGHSHIARAHVARAEETFASVVGDRRRRLCFVRWCCEVPSWNSVFLCFPYDSNFDLGWCIVPHRGGYPCQGGKHARHGERVHR